MQFDEETMRKPHILVVEDDVNILELIRHNLSKAGYRVTSLTSGEKVLLSVGIKRPDLILLDLMLPGIDGLEVCRLLRSEEETAHIPIIMVTAKTEEEDIVTGLEQGADDYITKPFSPQVLLARTRAVLRRQKRDAQLSELGRDPLRIGELTVDPRRHLVELAGQELKLTLTEYKILYLLAKQPGWVFTRYQIVEAVRGSDYNVTDRAVDVLIFGLRKKLGPCGKLIETVRGVGYRFRE